MRKRLIMTAACIPLVVHSHYSLCRGVASVPALVDRAAAWGYPALALTDRDNLYGAVSFHAAARERGVAPILGAEITSTDGASRVVCLVRTMDGYSNLCRLVTRRMMDPAFDLEAAVPALGGGLHLLTDDATLALALRPHVPPGGTPRRPGGPESSDGRLWLLLADPPRHASDWAALAGLSRTAGIPLVASPDVAWLDESDRALQATVTAIRERDLVTRVAPPVTALPGSAFPEPAALIDRFRDFPGALAANRLVREECGAFELRLGKPIFPKYPLPPGESAYSFLFSRCLQGMARRYGGLHPPAMRRLTSELEVIDRLGFNEYFVIVGDICKFAHDSGIPTVGRGSGAGSIVAYLLGITNVDPLRYRLYFERFLHEKRRDLPDLDIDLCWRRRDDVIAHVYRTYGADRVAMISTHNTFQARGAFRDVARAHGVSPATVNRWSKAVPGHSSEPLATVLGRGTREADLSLDDPRVRTIVEEADRLVGAPRHLGIHCGGIVIGDRPLAEYVPLEEATKGIVVTQYEMHAIEKIGLVKIDLLGNRAISTISETVRLVEEAGGPRIDPATIPDGDAAAATLMSTGDTLGVFQLESPGMRNLVRQLETRDLNGAIAALSLIRPGPAGSGMKERFIRRARGLEPVTYSDPRLREALEETYGVLLYEEDVMAVSAALAGLSLAEGDLLRRAIAEIDDPEDEAAAAGTFLAGAIRNGTPPRVAEEVWKQLRQFAAYAFCKAHASGYGVLAYHAAWLKAHHPAAFAVAILNNHAAMYEPRVHLEDARRHGVGIWPPCVNRSLGEYSLETADDKGGRGAVRVGLSCVRGLSTATIERLLAERPFADLADAVARARPQRPEAESLVLAGAFDFTGATRPALLFELRMTRSDRRGGEGLAGAEESGRLFAAPPPDFSRPALRDFDLPTRRKFEYEVLGLATEAHPMTLFDTTALLPSRRLPAARGRGVRLGGLVAAQRRVRVKKSGEPMLFLTLEDEDGLFECTLFPAVYRRYGGLLRHAGPWVVQGKAEDQYGAVTVNVERLAPWA